MILLCKHVTAMTGACDLLEEIYSDVCCSDADYVDRPYYEIIEVEE